MKVYFATWLYDKTLGKTLTKHRARNRLISYHFLKEQGISTSLLDKYITYGKANTNKRKK